MKKHRIAVPEGKTMNGEVAVKNRWWLSGVCLLILTAVFVSLQGLATMGGAKAKTTEHAVSGPRRYEGVQAVSYGRSAPAPVIPPRSGWSEEPPQEGSPYDEGRLPDVQTDDPRNLPDQDEMNQEEPFQVAPPDEDYLDSMPPDEDQPSEQPEP